MSHPGAGLGEYTSESCRWDLSRVLAVAQRQGDPKELVQALHNWGGEQAVAAALERARFFFYENRRANEATDELSSLLAQCAIGTLPPISTPEAPQHMSVEPTSQAGMADSGYGAVEGSILAESGRQQVVWDASADGSSFFCHQCGGVVSNSRRDEHFTFWCSAAGSS